MTDSTDLNALADWLSFAATNTNGCLYSQRKMLNNAAKSLRAAASSQAGVLAMREAIDPWVDTRLVTFDATIVFGHGGLDFDRWEGLRSECHTRHGSFAIWKSGRHSWSIYGGKYGLLALDRYSSERQAKEEVSQLLLSYDNEAEAVAPALTASEGNAESSDGEKPSHETRGGAGDDCSVGKRGVWPPDGSDGIAVGERGPESSVAAGRDRQPIASEGNAAPEAGVETATPASNEPVGWQVWHSDGWSNTHEDNIECYREKGIPVRPIYTHPTPAPSGNEALRKARDLIGAERQRQIDVEGWSTSHDDLHADGELLRAGMCYLNEARSSGAYSPKGVPLGWPWHKKWWKPADQKRNYIKAGALFLAERERLIRAGNLHHHVDAKIALVEKLLAALSTPAPAQQEVEVVESIAKWLHDETDHPNSYPNYTWPETDRDDGQRDGGFVKIVPLHAQAYFRDIARRLVRGYPAPAQQAVDVEAVKRAQPAIDNLINHQEQCDQDGVMVKVSRQALDEVLALINGGRDAG